jgi:hypothetical protein
VCDSELVDVVPKLHRLVFWEIWLWNSFLRVKQLIGFLRVQSLKDGALQGCEAGDEADRWPEARHLGFAEEGVNSNSFIYSFNPPAQQIVVFVPHTHCFFQHTALLHHPPLGSCSSLS